MSERERLALTDARDRAIAHSVLGGAALQAIIVLTSLVSLPFVARGLSTSEFGVLTTLTGLLGVLSFADLGVGSALTTRIAQREAQDEPVAGRIAVSTALVAAGVAGVIVLILLGVSAWILPWTRILGANHLPGDQVRAAVLVTAVAVALSVVGSLGQRVLYGLHRGGQANMWLVMGAVLGGILTIIAAASDAGLVWLVATTLITPAAVGLTCTGWVLVRGAPRMRPRLGSIAWSEWIWLRRQSGWFFVVAVSGAAAFQTDALIVAGVLGAASAGVYGVAARLFGLISQALYPGLLQLWPAFTDAYVRGDMRWIRSRLVGAAGLCIAMAGLAGGVLLVVGEELVSAWLTPDLAPPAGLLLAFAVWTAYSLASATIYLLFNAVGLVKVHALAAAAVALVNLPVSIVLTRVIGLEGPVWGSLIAATLCSATPALYFLPRVLRGELIRPGASPGASDSPVASG